MKSISPLRYPGGKSRLYEQTLEILKKTNATGYAEPFSGGFGIGLLLLLNEQIDNVYINDLDINIYSFWKSIKIDHKYLVKEIKRVNNLDRNSWLKERTNQKNILNSKKYGFRKKGFALLFLNRVNRSGIISAGPIGGISQSGDYKIDCRFNATRLIELIENIATKKDNLFISNLPCNDFLSNIDDQNIFVFLDPPYYVKGGALYMNNFKDDDHRELETYLTNYNNPWIMTYDDVDEIKKIYSDEKYIIKEFKLNHYAGNFKVGEEILISYNSLNLI